MMMMMIMMMMMMMMMMMNKQLERAISAQEMHDKNKQGYKHYGEVTVTSRHDDKQHLAC